MDVLTPKLIRQSALDADNVTPLRTDAVIAAEIREQLSPLLDQICTIMSKARADGYEVSWSIQPDSFGRHLRCTEIAIRKPL
jgi:hypothetical protein